MVMKMLMWSSESVMLYGFVVMLHSVFEIGVNIKIHFPALISA
jgi:hypothetical protein